MSTMQVAEPGGAVEALDNATLLAQIEQALAVLDKRPLAGAVGDHALTIEVERLHRIETKAAAQKLRRIAEVDAREAWRGEGHRSTVDLVADHLHVTRGEARAQTETAKALATLPKTAAKLRSGEVSVAHAHQAARTAAQIRPDARDQLDTVVADAVGLDRRQLRDHVDTWAQTVDPDALAERDRRAWDNRTASVTADTPDGMTHAQARLDPAGGATLIAALEARARKSGPDDTRTYPQRLADALVDLARAGLDGSDGDEAKAAPRAQVIVITETGPDGELARARLDGVGPVSNATAQQLSCDSDTTHVIVHRNGDVLDVGRTRRDPTKPQRVAVIARDKACVGCGAPAARSEIHHVRWWVRDHGPTDEDNLVLVCWGCHTRIHHHGWHATRDPATRRFTLTAPAPRPPPF